MTLNGVMAVTLRYFTEFGKPAFQHNNRAAPICGGIFVVRVQCRRKESSRLLSHLLVSFLSVHKSLASFSTAFEFRYHSQFS